MNKLSYKIFLGLSSIVTILQIFILFWYSQYGFDFTDESFLIVSIANPYNNDVTVSLFGYIYYPLYQLVNGSISGLRQLNIIITFFLAWSFTYTFFTNYFSDDLLYRWHKLIISGGFASASLFFSLSGRSTPGYYSLNLQALLIAATGLIIAENKGTIKSLFGWIIIGVGGWLAFMAKPTTAVALIPITLFFLLASRKFNYKLIIISGVVAIGLFITSAIVIDSSLISHITRFNNGLYLASIDNSGHTIIESLVKLFSFPKIIMSLITIIFVLYYLFIKYENKYKNKQELLYSSLIIIYLCIISLLNKVTLFNEYGVAQLLIWSVPAIIIILFVSQYRDMEILKESNINIGFTLFLVPHAFAFGSNINYWIIGSGAGIFWIFSGLLITSKKIHEYKNKSLLLLFCIVIQIITCIAIIDGLKNPTRQQEPLYKCDSSIQVGKPGSYLILSKGYNEYISSAIFNSQQAKFLNGTGVIDLTGQSPGLLYSIGALSIGNAWIIGGYPGSNHLAIEYLKRVSNDQLATAWLLVEPSGPRSISTKVLQCFGADISKDYKVVASWMTAEGAGGFKKPRLQMLLKPIRPISLAIASCEASKNEVNK